jgi:hypothetical protein
LVWPHTAFDNLTLFSGKPDSDHSKNSDTRERWSILVLHNVQCFVRDRHVDDSYNSIIKAYIVALFSLSIFESFVLFPVVLLCVYI